jgi:hypothetical protein
MGFGLFAAAFVGSAVGLWLVSQFTEALRPVPQTPKTLRWAPEIPIGYVDIGGLRDPRGQHRRGRLIQRGV